MRTTLVTILLAGGALIGAACTEVPEGSGCWYDTDGLLVAGPETGPQRCYPYRDDQENNWEFVHSTTTTTTLVEVPAVESSTTTTVPTAAAPVGT